jgi:hypothetical protein
MTDSQPIAEVCHKGKLWSLIPGGTDAGSYFGGPHRDHVESNVDLEAAIIHHIATINLPKFGVGNPRFGFSVPLFYGVCHEGCTIEYRKTATAAVEITSLDPAEAGDGYPYHGYPAVIPYFELGIGETQDITPSDLEDRLANTGWTIRDDCLYIIVMQHPAVGHCLFEPGSDVEIVFEYDPAAGTVRATNQCS